ncbi:hypothetical protein AAFF_G00049200 [Aldrovandia affinis]|uniref:Uncharacterized protein n=1 Tax=Aldrovandia affinis TaxID=143900 RepID=A0AAD7S1E9_9TELE|nr:hypothetical protein AAFF_G00049200 [Aldrovandia affinis]
MRTYRHALSNASCRVYPHAGVAYGGRFFPAVVDVGGTIWGRGGGSLMPAVNVSGFTRGALKTERIEDSPDSSRCLIHSILISPEPAIDPAKLTMDSSLRSDR